MGGNIASKVHGNNPERGHGLTWFTRDSSRVWQVEQMATCGSESVGPIR